MSEIKYGKIRRVNSERSEQDKQPHATAEQMAKHMKKTRAKSTSGVPVTGSSNTGKRTSF